MIRSEIVSKLSDKIKPKIKKKETEKIVDIILNTIISNVKKQKSAEIRQFGRFFLKKIKGRVNARNPKTGQNIQTKDRNSISFKMSKVLRSKINKGSSS
tara:strand:- start:266 stop:562 length:297 start_codon:yes stop_codon:yes gene_type:complete